MDSPLEGRVYDPRTLAAGGPTPMTLPTPCAACRIIIHKENTSPMWHREEQVRQQNPDLIVSHLSCLFDQRVSAEAAVRRHLFDMAQHRLVGFFGYVASVNPHTNSWSTRVAGSGPTKKPGPATWSARFPQLSGRLFTLTVPGGENATFAIQPPCSKFTRGSSRSWDYNRRHGGPARVLCLLCVLFTPGTAAPPSAVATAPSWFQLAEI